MATLMQKLIPSKTIFFISTLIGVIFVFAYNYFLLPRYSATALIKVGTPTYSNMRVDTEVELLKSNLFISKALKDVDISHFYYQIINYKSYPIDEISPFKVSITRGYNILFSLTHENSTSYRLKANGKDGLESWSYDEVHQYGERINNSYFNLLINRVDGILFDGFDYTFIVYTHNSLISKIKESLDIKRLNNSSIIEITYHDSLPLRAKSFIEALATVSTLESKKGKIIEKKPLLLATLKLQNIDANATTINKEDIEVKATPNLLLNRIIDMPYSATKESINYISYIIFILVFNMLVALVFPFIFRFKDSENDKRTFEDIKSDLDCILIGDIPYISEYTDEESGVATVSMLVSDSFKEVRDNLQFMSPDPTSQIISITTDKLMDIHTTSNIILNLSNSITYGGQRVVVLDLNMQNPSIHQRFNLFNDDGVSTVLSHRAMISKVVRYTENENLDIVTAGSYPPNPWELIDSTRMEEVLDKLRNVYDVIILNMPPLRDDKLNIFSSVDVNIYIMDKGSLDSSRVDRLNSLKREIKGFSVLFYDNKA
jgi:capsular exopolysaccharide synthesis family protein